MNLHQDILSQLANNENLLQAIRIELLNSVDINELNPFDMTNEELGAEVRARMRAKELVEAGLNKIKQLKSGQRSEEKNPAL